jgi:aminoglycoside 3-N-acetyltransferase
MKKFDVACCNRVVFREKAAMTVNKAETSPVPTVTGADIVAGLRELGLTAGAGVMVHSSLKSFGRVEGGARTVIAALMEVITPDGTLLFPSFNHGRAFEAGQPGYFDPRETPTTNGAIPDLVWRMPEVLRSLAPTHAFAAWGKNARRYTEFHHRTLTMGPQSPLGLLWKDGGYGLLLGVGYGSNTFHHVVETTVGAPCLGPRTEAYPVRLPGGRSVMGRAWGWRDGSCPFTKFGQYQREMRARGLDRTRLIGNSRATLFPLRDCFEIAARILRNGADGFPPCSGCPIRPLRNPWTVPSDWDAQAQRPLPDSESWTY